MARLALAGSYYNLSGLTILADGERTDVQVGDRTVPVLDCGDFVFLPRHGMEHYTPPHEIDHVANMKALDQLGCDRILAIGSVCMRVPLPGAGAITWPEDFIVLTVGISAIGDARGYPGPGVILGGWAD